MELSLLLLSLGLMASRSTSANSEILGEILSGKATGEIIQINGPMNSKSNWEWKKVTMVPSGWISKT